MHPPATIGHDGRAAHAGREPADQPTHEVRRVLVGGLLGGLPGLLIVGVPVLLHSVGAISADQSQVGFIGVPLLVIGIFAGIVVTAADTGRTGSVVLGAVVGFVGGLVVGVVATAALLAAGVAFPGTWLLLAAAGTLAGAAFGAVRS